MDLESDWSKLSKIEDVPDLAAVKPCTVQMFQLNPIAMGVLYSCDRISTTTSISVTKAKANANANTNTNAREAIPQIHCIGAGGRNYVGSDNHYSSTTIYRKGKIFYSNSDTKPIFQKYKA